MKQVAMRTAMSIDVEDWFHAENLQRAIPRDTWRKRELRVERTMDRILELMAGSGVTSTCFILGWIAERAPALVRRIADAGHEIASHGYAHELIPSLTRSEFRADVERSKKMLEDLTGARVNGYRAPSFSITDWSIPILQDVGFSYDSSSFPTIAHDRYGKLSGVDPSASVVEVRPGFHEVAISCLRVGGYGIPWGGGGYFRLVPYPVFRRGILRILGSGHPYVFYLHPWEIDSRQPRIRGVPGPLRFRHYTGVDHCEDRFTALLAEFPWAPVSELVRDGGGSNAD